MAHKISIGRRILNQEEGVSTLLGIAFLALMVVLAVAVSAMGYPQLAGIVVSMGLILFAITILFVSLPIYLLNFLD